MESESKTVNCAERTDFEQAADALATLGMKAEKELCKSAPSSPSQEPKGDPIASEPKIQHVEKRGSENRVQKEAYCSACMKHIPNPISDGHGIVDGHVGQFRMLIPWSQQPDGTGFLCSRCYQRNWRLNKQRVGSSGYGPAEEIPREPYRCLCGMTFQSSQLKAAHCRLCQKYRDIADQEQRREGTPTTPKSTSATPKEGACKRPRSGSEHRGKRSSFPEERKEKSEEGFVTPPPPPISMRGMGVNPLSSFMSSFEKLSTTPLAKPTPVQAGLGCISTLPFQKLQLVQLLQTTRLLGQVDIVQYASMIDMINSSNDPVLLSEMTQLVLQMALKPLVYAQQFIGNPPNKMARFDTDSKPLTLFPSVFKLPVELESHTQAMK